VVSVSQGATNESDDIEVARGVVSALSYSGPTIAREFHVLAFRAAFGQFSDAGRYRLGLAAMKLVGEIEQLRDGYWIATPVRFVDLGNRDLIIAPIPSRRLALELPDVTRTGFGRVLPPHPTLCQPRQSLESWARATRATPVDVATFINDHYSQNYVRSAVCESFEFFCTKVFGKKGSAQRTFAWTSDIKRSPTVAPNTWLGRERVSSTGYRFFLLKGSGSGKYLECSLDRSPLRIQYAIAALASSPIRYSVQSAGDRTSAICLVTPLPQPEYRILRTICFDCYHIDGVRQFIVDNEYLSMLESWLQHLGCEKELQ
jgi:hypothetical protein